MKKKKKIKKPFCCYGGGVSYWGVGKIIEEEEKCCIVLYSITQEFPPQVWDPEYLVRFDTLQEALNEYKMRTGLNAPTSAKNLDLDWVQKIMRGVKE